MNSEMAVSWVWAAVYLGLAGFFLIGARRLPRRGYELLGVTLAAVAVSELGEWLLAAGSPATAFLGARLIVACLLLAPALHTHFVFILSGRKDARRVAFGGYVLAGAGAFADWASAAGVLGKLDALERPLDYIAPFDTVSFFIASLFCGHALVACVALGLAARQGRPNTVGPFFIALTLGPAVAFDVTQLVVYSQHYSFTEAIAWVYGLVIVAGLLEELRGAEGLLRKTTSSLAERTAELEVSYAEMELMHSELSRKQQLAAVGELAAAIAHEVRNPLAIIMNAASGLRRDRLPEDDKETLLSILDEESERLNQLVNELLRFARPVTASPAPASLYDICQRVASAAADDFEVEVVSEKKVLEPALVDAGLFSLALENLLSNAAQAMPAGGRLTIRLRRSAFEDGSPAAAIDVIDQGVGMTEDVLAKARKPFFTTRPRGAGLGLPIVERIVEAHGGEMSVESRAGRGTTVTLKVPFEDDPALRYPGSKSPTGRRRLRSVPPSSRPPPPLEQQ